MNTKINFWPAGAFVAAVLCAAAASSAQAYVLPQLGGGQTAMSSAPMKHADVTLQGTTLVVHLDETVPVPLLRTLAPPSEFDPAMPWHVLNGTAHNFQYGWNPSGFWAPPAGAGVWIEQLSATPGLEVYYVSGPPPSTPYDPIFGTDGSSSRWQWSGAMTHNAYAVANPARTEYEATYRVYIGDAVTGEPWSQYSPADVTFSFAADVPSADFDLSGAIDGDDYLLWQRNFGSGVGSPADADENGLVDGADLAFWQRQYGAAAASAAGVQAIPEPAAAILAALAMTTMLRRRAPT